MKKSYVEKYHFLSETHWWWNSRNNFVMRKVKGLLLDKIKILDVGCGSGTVTKELRRYGQVTAIEPDLDLFKKIQIPDVKIHNCDLLRFNTTETYDLIVMLDVLEHIEDDNGALIRLGQLLNKQGHILINVPAYNSLWSKHDDINLHYRRYQREAIETLFRSHGFQILESRYLFASLYFLKKLFLLIEKNQNDTKQTILLPSFLNLILVWYFSVENYIINTRFGSSLFIIARKI